MLRGYRSEGAGTRVVSDGRTIRLEMAGGRGRSGSSGAAPAGCSGGCRRRSGGGGTAGHRRVPSADDPPRRRIPAPANPSGCRPGPHRRDGPVRRTVAAAARPASGAGGRTAPSGRDPGDSRRPSGGPRGRGATSGARSARSADRAGDLPRLSSPRTPVGAGQPRRPYSREARSGRERDRQSVRLPSYPGGVGRCRGGSSRLPRPSPLRRGRPSADSRRGKGEWCGLDRDHGEGRGTADARQRGRGGAVRARDRPGRRGRRRRHRVGTRFPVWGRDYA